MSRRYRPRPRLCLIHAAPHLLPHMRGPLSGLLDLVLQTQQSYKHRTACCDQGDNLCALILLLRSHPAFSLLLQAAT